MDTSRLLALAPILAQETATAIKYLKPLREALKTGRMLDVPKLRSEAEKILRLAPSTQFVPSWLVIVNKIGAKTLHAREVLRRMNHILDDEDLKPQEKGLLIESLEADLANFENILRSTEGALKAIRESPRTIPTEKSEVGVLYPDGAFGDLEEFAREITELNRHLRSISEVAGEARSPSLSSLETGTFEIFFTTGTAVGALVATIVWRLLRTWKQIEEIRKLRAETRKIDAEASDLLEKRAKRQRDEAVQRIHTEVMGQSAPSVDQARKNELEISVKQAIAFIDERIQRNVLFEVSVAVQIAPGGTAPRAREKDAAQLIRERGAAMWEVQAKMSQPLLPVQSESQEEDTPATGGA